MSDTCLDDSLIMATRLTEASGWTMIGGLPTLGRACAWVIRSWTICRAEYTFVPGWNVRSIADSPGIEAEWILSSQGTPLSRSCSSGTVMSCSTSAADRPSASVCTSTDVGRNSGYTSTGAARSWAMPITSNPMASATTSRPNRRPEPMIQPIAGNPLRQAHRRYRDGKSQRRPGHRRRGGRRFPAGSTLWPAQSARGLTDSPLW